MNPPDDFLKPNISVNAYCNEKFPIPFEFHAFTDAKDISNYDSIPYHEALELIRYENLFRNGLRLSIASMENNDIKKGLKSQKLLNEWGEYYRKTRVKIFKK